MSPLENAFLSTPSLWSRISAFRRLEKTEVYLERSGNTLLDISISLYALWTQGAYASFQMTASLSNRWRTARFLKERLRKDIPAVLPLEVPDRTKFRGIEDLNGFPSLKSLTLIGDIGYLRFPQPIDSFQRMIFGHFNQSVNNECRISALVPLVKESWGIYRFITSMLRAMHRRESHPAPLVSLI